MAMGRLMEQPAGMRVLCDAECWVRVPPAAIEPLLPVLPKVNSKPRRNAELVLLPPVPRPVKRVAPRYPTDRHGNAEVRLIVEIAEDGTVRDVRMSATDPGDPAFARAAEAAVRQWMFAPGIAGLYRLTIKFRIQ